MSLYIRAASLSTLYRAVFHTQAYVFSVATARELIIQKHYTKIYSYAYKILTILY